MPPRRESSRPPSDPQPLRESGHALGGDERPSRAQLAAALAVGLVLAGSGLYLWRRPHTVAPEQATEAASAAPSASVEGGPGGPIVGAAGADAGAGSSPILLSEPRVLACQDRGSKKTAPDGCDRVAALEQALSSAIAQAAACVPPSAGGGTIEYVADVSFPRHKVNVSLPRAGRSVRDRKTLKACSTAVRGAIAALGLDAVEHQHARYKIAVTATYRAASGG